MKTVISHSFSEKYGYDNYLTLSNFQSTTSEDIRDLKYVAFSRLDKQLITINLTDVMDKMGYHREWNNLLLLK